MAGAEEFGLSVLMSNIYLFQWFSIVASCKLAKLQSFCKITAPYFEAQLGANRIPQQIPLLLTGRAVDFLIHPSYLFFPAGSLPLNHICFPGIKCQNSICM